MYTVRLLWFIVLGCLVVHGREEEEKLDVMLKECPRHAHYTDCGYHNCGELLTCATPVMNQRRCSMSRFCIPGCVCDKGYLMDSKGACVRPHKCDVRPPCGTNEVFDFCPRHSEDRSCADVIDAIYPVRLGNFAPSCRCLPGYVRNHMHACVLPKTCLDFWRRPL